MKSRNDPRHQHREHLLQQLFSWDFRKDKPHRDIEKIIENIDAIDKKISEGAPMWPIEKMARVDLAIMRMSVWELYYSGLNTPAKVVVDESVELGKEYGSDTTYSFVNGALGAILKKYPVKEEGDVRGIKTEV